MSLSEKDLASVEASLTNGPVDRDAKTLVAEVKRLREIAAKREAALQRIVEIGRKGQNEGEDLATSALALVMVAHRAISTEGLQAIEERLDALKEARAKASHFRAECSQAREERDAALRGASSDAKEGELLALEVTRLRGIVAKQADEIAKLKGAAPVDDMALPSGKVCGDCAHWKRCSSLIGSLTGFETSCDFAPSRFKEATRGDQA